MPDKIQEPLVPNDPVVAQLFGRIEGQLRELFHTKRDDLQKQQAAESILVQLKDVPADITEIKTRLNVLEADGYRREGASKLIEMIFRSPLLLWIGMIATAVWVYVKGGK